MRAVLTTAHITGAGIGLLGGLGAWLVTARVLARRVRLEDRLAPYLRLVDQRSRLLEGPAVRSPFPTLERLLAPVMADAVRLVEQVSSSALDVRRRLERAGTGTTVEQFRAEQVVWGVLGLAGGLVLALLSVAGRGAHPVVAAAGVLLAGAGGVLARDHLLSRRVAWREARMLAEFPTVAELLALAVGAGESAAGALDRVARTTRGELAAELGRTVADARAGAPLTVAFQRLGDRTGVPGLTRFADGVAVAVERGTPLADVLRAQAQDVREAGRRELIEAGGRKEVLMMIPVVFLILPVTVVFAIFPGLTVLRIGL